MARIIELFGLPGSGKSFLTKEIIFHLSKKIKVVDRTEGVKQALIRRNDGFYTALFKKIPYAIWHKIIHEHYCLSEFLEFSSRNIKLMSYYQRKISGSNVEIKIIRNILGAFASTCIERQLFENHGYDDELVLADEGFCHRFFTLYGNLVIPCDQQEVTSYLNLIPPVHGVIFISTPIDICIERMEKRKRFTNILDHYGKSRSIDILQHGFSILEKIFNELADKHVNCFQYNGISSDILPVVDFCMSCYNAEI